jgi:hypothetical protein
VCGDEPGGVVGFSTRVEIKADWTNLIISGGSCDQGFTPVEDLPLFEGSVEFGVVSIDCLCHG